MTLVSNAERVKELEASLLVLGGECEKVKLSLDGILYRIINVIEALRLDEKPAQEKQRKKQTPIATKKSSASVVIACAHPVEKRIEAAAMGHLSRFFCDECQTMIDANIVRKGNEK